MPSKWVTVRHAHGLHARPASLFINLAKQFVSAVELKKGEKRADGKSILGVMGLAIKENETIEVTTSGEDEQEALDQLVKFLLNE
jgi:phosphotransferase system HPr (HPr) family protein